MLETISFLPAQVLAAPLWLGILSQEVRQEAPLIQFIGLRLGRLSKALENQ